MTYKMKYWVNKEIYFTKKKKNNLPLDICSGCIGLYLVWDESFWKSVVIEIIFMLG